jgi:hypothetical protein
MEMRNMFSTTNQGEHSKASEQALLALGAYSALLICFLAHTISRQVESIREKPWLFQHITESTTIAVQAWQA